MLDVFVRETAGLWDAMPGRRGGWAATTASTLYRVGSTPTASPCQHPALGRLVEWMRSRSRRRRLRQIALLSIVSHETRPTVLEFAISLGVFETAGSPEATAPMRNICCSPGSGSPIRRAGALLALLAGRRGRVAPRRLGLAVRLTPAWLGQSTSIDRGGGERLRLARSSWQAPAARERLGARPRRLHAAPARLSLRRVRSATTRTWNWFACGNDERHLQCTTRRRPGCGLPIR
jgi:hypothetical protein